jgi:hypothetical protein
VVLSANKVPFVVLLLQSTSLAAVTMGSTDHPYIGEIIRRLQELNESGKTTFHVRAFTRDDTCSKKSVASANMKNVSVVQVDYKAPHSLIEAMQGVDAVFVNYIMCKEELTINKNIVDTAIGADVKHIIYSSTVSCDKKVNQTVPYWNTSYETEQCIAQAFKNKTGDSSSLKYHFIRLAHFNENLLPGSYFPPKNGTVTYRIHGIPLLEFIRVRFVMQLE